MTPSVKAIQAHCSIGWKESVKTRSPTWIVATTSQTVPGRAERQEPVVSAVRSRGRAGRPRRDVPSRGPLSRLCSDPQRCGVSIAGHCGRSRGRLCRGYVLSAGDYKPRDAEHAVLYRVIDEHLDAFLETARRHADGTSLPAFVEQEFRDFLTCGVLAQASRACGAPSAPSSGWCRSRARGHAGASSAASRRNRRRARLKSLQNGRPSSSIRGEFQRR